MSYCRFSTDCFRCDIYAYGSVDGGFSIHVAGYKKPVPDDWQDPWVLFDKMPPEEWTALYKKFTEDYDALPDHVPINLPNAGASYHEATLHDFKERMLALRVEGFRFPDYVLENIDEEIAEERAVTPTASEEGNGKP